MMFEAVPRAHPGWVRPMPTGSRSQLGFTYIGLLIAVAIFGLGSVGAARLLASTERAEREAELLFVGHQFRQAIRGYLQSGTRAGQYPATLDDLLQDKRYITPRRHLRRVFVDPITGKAEWGLVVAPEGGIMGVYSLSDREPLKRANFDPEDSAFAASLQPSQAPTKSTILSPFLAASSSEQPTPMNKAAYSYSDWKFVYRPGV